MNTQDAQYKTIQDLAILYELALNIGRSLDLKENCDRALKPLMARKNLKYAGLWLKQSLLEPGQTDYYLAYASPRFWIEEKQLSFTHPLFTTLALGETFTIVDSASTPDQFQALITEKKVRQGRFVILRLGEIGILKLYASTHATGLERQEIIKLLSVVDSFTSSIQACLAHQLAIYENEQRRRTELALRQAEMVLAQQLQELSYRNRALQQAKQEVDSKNSHLETALIALKQAQTHVMQEKLMGLGQLVAGIAHEINNPISFIYGNIPHLQAYINELITLLKVYQQAYPQPDPIVQAKVQESDLAFLLEDIPRLLDSMELGSERIRQIVLALRSFSRLDESERKSVDLHLGLENTLMLLQHRLQARPDRPEIQVYRHYGDLPLVDCYPSQLNQVFMSILSNAIDALDEGVQQRVSTLGAPLTPWITLRTEVDGANVRIAIANNGPPIPEIIQQRIFDPFFTTKPIGQGTGLGLSISYQIVTENHGGQLQCISTSEQETEFRIELPHGQGEHHNFNAS